jgi:hypothetical protein
MEGLSLFEKYSFNIHVFVGEPDGVLDIGRN